MSRRLYELDRRLERLERDAGSSGIRVCTCNMETFAPTRVECDCFPECPDDCGGCMHCFSFTVDPEDAK